MHAANSRNQAVIDTPYYAGPSTISYEKIAQKAHTALADVAAAVSGIDPDGYLRDRLALASEAVDDMAVKGFIGQEARL
jgi:hypothetical protein